MFITPLGLLLFDSEFFGIKIFTFFEFLLISIFYYERIFIRNKNLIFTFFSSLFLGTLLYENLTEENSSFDSFSVGVSAITILTYSIIFLYSIVSNTKKVIKIDWQFIISTALIIYFSGTFFIYILSKNNFYYKDFQASYDLINPIILITRNSMFLFAFVNYRKNESQIQVTAHSITHS